MIPERKPSEHRTPCVLCIGSAVIDICAFPIGREETWKDKQRIEKITLAVGGDAANQSRRMADFGIASVLVSCTGDDENGRFLRRALIERGVDTAFLHVKESEPTATALVLLGADGERHIFSVKGAHSLLSKRDLPPLTDDHGRALYDGISLASLFSMPVLEKEGLLTYLEQARAAGIPVVADLAADKFGLGLDGIRSLLPWIDYFIPSEEEVLAMTRTDTAEDAARTLHAQGCAHVIVKCGARGCYALDAEGGRWQAPPNIRAVDTTGAGDCLNAAFFAGLLQGFSLEKTLLFANVAAAASCLHVGASDWKLTREELICLEMQEIEQAHSWRNGEESDMLWAENWLRF